MKSQHLYETERVEDSDKWMHGEITCDIKSQQDGDKQEPQPHLAQEAKHKIFLLLLARSQGLQLLNKFGSEIGETFSESELQDFRISGFQDFRIQDFRISGF